MYMHFPPDQRLLDAAMGALAGREIEAGFDPQSGTPERIAAIVDTFWDHVEEWLPIGAEWSP